MTSLAYIVNLRHAKNVALTTFHTLEKIAEECPDRIAEEGIKEALQDIQKVISSITNELNRYGAIRPDAILKEERKKNGKP